MRKNSGQTLVELALALPVLAVILFAIIQYGFILSTQVTLRHAAQVTSRSMTLSGANTNNVNTVAQQALGPLLDSSKLDPVDLDKTTVGGTEGYQVTLTYNMPLIIKFVVPNATGNSLTLTATAVDRIN